MSDKEVVDVATNQAVQSGWTDTLQERGKYVMTWLHESRAVLLDIVLYGGLGFLSGYLLRKYANYVAFLVLVSVGIIVMHQYNIIHVEVNWTQLNDLLGFQHSPSTADGASFVAFWEWCKVNAVIVVSYIVGLLIGLKIG